MHLPVDPDSETSLRRATDRSPLGRAIGPIERAYGTGDYARAAELLEQRVLHAWYGFTPDRFTEMVTALAGAGVPQRGILQGLARFVRPEQDPGVGPDTVMAALPTLPEGSAGIAPLAVATFSLRLQGHPVGALRASRSLRDRTASLQPLFDTTGGWGLFGVLQHGITAMLAGRFSSALAHFEQARFHVVVPALSFLSRDALVKAAVLHAAYGDARQARALLVESTGMARTESWVEAVIDASAVIARALLADEGPAAALRELDGVPLHTIGEMWPFYLVAMHRAHVEAGNTIEAERRLDFFAGLPLPRNEGEGFTGSVLPCLQALGAIARREFADARASIARCDPSLALTREVRAILDLASGRPREVLLGLSGLQEQTLALRKLELWRLSLLAEAHRALGEHDDCRDVLKYARDALGGLRADDMPAFSSELQGFAEAQSLSGWPAAPAGTRPYLDQFSNHGGVLSARELDVLRDLARGLTREEIAKAQFISINTLKAHLRSAYRKLGVNSRAAAVLEAERRGLLEI